MVKKIEVVKEVGKLPSVTLTLASIEAEVYTEALVTVRMDGKEYYLIPKEAEAVRDEDEHYWDE